MTDRPEPETARKAFFARYDIEGDEPLESALEQMDAAGLPETPASTAYPAETADESFSFRYDIEGDEPLESALEQMDAAELPARRSPTAS